MNFINLPKKNIIYLLVCGTTLLAVSIFLLIANYRMLSILDKNISRMKNQIDVQEFFSPVFKKLFNHLDFEEPEGLSLPKPLRMPREDTAKTLALLQEMAQKSRFKVEGISPDVDSTIDGSKHLMINIILQGDFLDLRSFLSQLIVIPYLEHIEQIKINSIKGTKEIRMRIWMSKE